jgi:hypothetical protein
MPSTRKFVKEREGNRTKRAATVVEERKVMKAQRHRATLLDVLVLPLNFHAHVFVDANGVVIRNAMMFLSFTTN